MAETPSPHLSKSRYLAGRQCRRRLWLTAFMPELADPVDRAREAIFEAGLTIGRRAHALFPGGVLVDEATFPEALARTRALLDDPTIPAIYEAAFEHAGVRIRVDVLERMAGDAWGLREVKSGTRVKEVHLDDVAVQRYVLEGSGLRVASVEVVHVDGRYVRGAGEIDWRQLFARCNVTREVEDRFARVAPSVVAMHDTLVFPAAPEIEPSPHCFVPYRCEFWGHCTREKPEDWIARLPRLRAERLEQLRDAGVERIGEIPDEFELTALQTRVRMVLQTGHEFVSPDLGQALDGFGPPAAYLDFETMGSTVPLYPGTHPYERVPFQWSLHQIDALGSVSHRAFLADGRSDPRRAFAESLLAALRARVEPIVVYSDFEDEVLGELAQTFPDLAEDLDAVRARLRDLLAVVRAHVYHRAFGYSFSLKSVAPALSPGFGYADLEEVSDGSQASLAFTRIAAGDCLPEEEARVRERLLIYCRRDTEALVAVHRALSEHCGVR